MALDFTSRDSIFHECPECGWSGSNFLTHFMCPMCKQGGDRIICEASTIEIKTENVLVNWTDPFGKELNLIHARRIVICHKIHDGSLEQVNKIAKYNKDGSGD